MDYVTKHNSRPFTLYSSTNAKKQIQKLAFACFGGQAERTQLQA